MPQLILGWRCLNLNPVFSQDAWHDRISGLGILGQVASLVWLCSKLFQTNLELLKRAKPFNKYLI
ncbi:MAG: hypothetical protein RMY29_001560 [Nostoc sp. CreGUA01]|nr:hypothetical protein [Nostoc sp. CreGUA01]